jgi:hypothetical protein
MIVGSQSRRQPCSARWPPGGQLEKKPGDATLFIRNRRPKGSLHKGRSAAGASRAPASACRWFAARPPPPMAENVADALRAPRGGPNTTIRFARQCASLADGGAGRAKNETLRQARGHGCHQTKRADTNRACPGTDCGRLILHPRRKNSADQSPNPDIATLADICGEANAGLQEPAENQQGFELRANISRRYTVVKLA